MEKVLEAYMNILKIRAKQAGICEKLKARLGQIEEYEKVFGVDLTEAKNIIVNMAIELGCGEIGGGEKQ